MIGAVIITYNPDLDTLFKNVNVLLSKDIFVVIVDNFSNNYLNVLDEYKNNSKVKLISNDRNYGIARALNQGFQYLYDQSFLWGISFDQDSECPYNLVEEAKKYLNIKDIGIITPVVYDKNLDGYLGGSLDRSVPFTYIGRCISSGAVTNLEIWKEVGKFDEQMFIDYVDFDYSTRVCLSNYKIIRLNNVVMNHELGKCTYKKIFNKKIRISNHSSFRKYYMGRNIVYYIRKYGFKINWVIEILRLIKIPIFIVFFEAGKIKKLQSFFKGIKGGFKLQIK